jgi:uncharacterized protein (DUF885 family)
MRLYCLAIALLLPIPALSQAPTNNLARFLADTFEERLRDRPEYATGAGRHEYDDRWTDWSKAGRDLRRSHTQKALDQLNQFAQTNLSAADRLTVRVLQYDFRNELESEEPEIYIARISQLNGFHNSIYQVVDGMPAHGIRDFENIIARLRAVPAYVDQNIGILDEAVAKGMVQPRIVIEIIAKQLAAQVAQDDKTSPLLAAFRSFPSNIPTAEQARLRSQASDAYEHQFLPAWRRLNGYMAGKYASNARAKVGLGSIPGGKEAYAVLVRRRTTTSYTPEQIHKIGEDEVKRIETEMLAIARETGFQGTLQEFDHNLHANPEQHFHGKEEMLAYCRNIAKIIEPQLPKQFKQIPPLLYGIRPIPEDREAASATSAQAPSPDFSTPGWMNLNAYKPEEQFKYDKEALVLHEAVPGHIFQLTLARGQRDLPDLRRFYSNNAYVEGWGLYAESLGAQLGVYRDPYSHFGQLASERFRAVRLVVDTGMHELGWTRDQAVEYFHQHAPGESLAEVDRYISWPGQALAYKMGQLKILELRREAEQKLGPKFDIRDYHDAVLRDGVLPLEVLGEQVENYINAAK